MEGIPAHVLRKHTLHMTRHPLPPPLFQRPSNPLKLLKQHLGVHHWVAASLYPQPISPLRRALLPVPPLSSYSIRSFALSCSLRMQPRVRMLLVRHVRMSHRCIDGFDEQIDDAIKRRHVRPVQQLLQ